MSTVASGRRQGASLRVVPRVLGYAGTAAVTLVFASPILYMFVASFKPNSEVLDGLSGFVPRHLSFTNYGGVFRRFSSDSTGYFWRFMLTSVVVTTVVVVGGLVVNSLAAYSFARLRWPGRNRVFTAVVALVILPFEAVAVPLFYLLNGLRDTLVIQFLPLIASAFSIYLFYTFFLSLPGEIEEAARVDGAGPWRTYFSIIVPMSKPAFASVTILTFLTQWSQFLWPVLTVSDPAVRPLPLAISVFQGAPGGQGFPWGEIMAFGVLMVAPVLVVFLLFQRWFVQSVAATGLKA